MAMTGFLCLGVLVPASSAEPADEALPLSPRETVWKFERSLAPLGELERARQVREFFAATKDPAVRIEAVGMLDSRYVYVVPKSVHAEILGQLLRDPEVKVRSRAARAVGYRGLGAEYRDALRDLLRREDPEIKHNALYAMGRSRDLRFAGPIREHLSHPQPRVRIDAAFSLFTLQRDAKELEALLADPEPAVRGAVVQLVPGAPAAKRLLADPSPHVRERTARAMGDSGNRNLISDIFPLLKDPIPNVRATAVYALGRLKAAEHGSRIEEPLAEDEHVVVRRYAATALGEIRSAKHLAGLRAALRDPDEQVRKSAERSIRLIENPSLDPDTVR